MAVLIGADGVRGRFALQGIKFGADSPDVDRDLWAMITRFKNVGKCKAQDDVDDIEYEICSIAAHTEKNGTHNDKKASNLFYGGFMRISRVIKIGCMEGVSGKDV